jgi:hypothetical protein
MGQYGSQRAGRFVNPYAQSYSALGRGIIGQQVSRLGHTIVGLGPNVWGQIVESVRIDPSAGCRTPEAKEDEKYQQAGEMI